MNRTTAPYVLHGFDVSYFTAKARVALRYKGVWLEERRADIAMILEKTGMGFIPIVTTPEGEVWQDTSDIIDALESRHPEPPLFPASGLQRLICALVEFYADEFALTLAMHTRWGTPEGEAMTRLRFGAMLGSVEQGNRAGDQMVKARYAVGATPEAAPAIEAHIDDLLAALNTHFDAHDYLLGARTSLADCALMGPFYAHFYTDLISRRMLLERAIPVVRWIEFCNMPGASSQGEWFADDAIPTSLIDVLRVMGQDAAPMLLALVASAEEWADEHAVIGEKPPRVVGRAESTLRGRPLVRGAQAYALWMLQRVLDPYRALPEAERQSVDAALAGTGWEAVLQYEPRHRIGKRGFDLCFVDATAAA
jgi:glutathione S-transferase